MDGTLAVSKHRRLALLKLIIGCRLKQQVNPLDCFIAMGFDADKLSHISASLPVLCQYLFKPFLSDQVFNLSHWNLENNVIDLLGEKRWWFRSAGPADLFLMMRAFQGLVVQLQYLETTLNWWDTLQQTVGTNLFEQAIDYELAVVTPLSLLKSTCFSEQAEKLYIEVCENSKPIVSVTLPAEAVFELNQIMPEDVTELLRQSESIDIEEIQEKLRQNGLIPQTLFEYHNGYKVYNVWLE